MKKNRVYLILLGAFVVIAAIVIYNKRAGTIPHELMDFAIADTASVNKIFLADKGGRQILLERENGHWKVNQQYIARKDAIDMLLKTIHRVEVKSPVSKASFDKIVTNLASEHVKVEIYTTDSEPTKVYYVGGATSDNYGTYMMLENSSTPFIMHIPGFNGYLTTRYFLSESEWRDVSLFRYEFNDIRTVRIEQPDRPEQSFEVSNDGNNQFQLVHLQTNKPAANFDTLMVKQYLAAYKKLNFERFVTELKSEAVDSIIQSKPVYIMSLSDKDGKTTRLRAFLRPAEMPTEQFPYDSDRMYAQLNESKELVIIQYFSFDPLFLDYSFFIK